MMRTSTDVQVTANVKISRALYNNKARRDSIKSAALVMQRALDVLRNYLDLPTDVSVRICTFRKSSIGGVYVNSQETAAINLRSYRGMITSLAHELVHAEQYHQGRLNWAGDTYMWKGDPVYNRGTTYNAYRNQPWEVEAFNRQDSLAAWVFQALKLPGY